MRKEEKHSRIAVLRKKKKKRKKKKEQNRTEHERTHQGFEVPLGGFGCFQHVMVSGYG